MSFNNYLLSILLTLQGKSTYFQFKKNTKKYLHIIYKFVFYNDSIEYYIL